MHRFLLLCSAVLLVAMSPGEFSQHLTWRNIGPAVIGGAVNDIVGARFQGSDGRPVFRLYVAGPGGLFASDDDGAHWQPLTDGLPGTAAVASVAISPRNPHEVWEASGDTNAIFRTVPGNGLYKSLDDGKHWQPAGFQNIPLIQFIRFDPRNQGTLYAGVIGDIRHATQTRGLYRSVDGGKTWKRVLYTNGWSGAVDVAFDPVNKDVLYVSMQQQGADRRVYRDYGPGSGVFKSTDGGTTWKKLSFPSPKNTYLARSAVAVAPSDPDRVYAVLNVVPLSGGGLINEGNAVKHAVAVYRSDDAGAHWTRGADLHLDIFTLYGHIYVDPKNADRVYALREGLAISNDGGKKFKSADDVDNPQKPQYSGPDDHALWIDPENNAHLVLGGDHGVFISTTGGASWRHVDSLTMARTYGLGIGNQPPFTRVVAAMQDSYDFTGPVRSPGRDGISNGDWTPLRIGSENGNAAVDPENNDVIYANGAYGAQRIEKTDLADGLKIALGPPVTLGQVEPPSASRQGTITLAGSQNPTLYVGTNRVMRSHDRGAHWEAISPIFSRGDASLDDLMGMKGKAGSIFWGWGLYDTVITAIAPSPIDAATLFAGTRDGIIALTRDSGAHWIKAVTPAGLLPAEVTSLAASHTSPGRVYASFSRYYEGDFRPYLYESRDYGKHWRSIAPPIPGAMVWSLVQHPENGNMLIAATSRGVLATTDDGESWFKVGNNLPNDYVTDLKLEPQTNTLLAATWGRGVWALDDLTPISQPVRQGCAQLFTVRPAYAYSQTHWTDYEAPVFTAPNPPDGAQIEYYLPQTQKDAKVRIRVRAADGTLLKTFDRPLTAGFHRVSWDVRLPQLGKADSAGPFVLPGTYQASLDVPSGVCSGRTRSQFAVAIAGQTPALLAEYRRAYPQHVLVYRLEDRVSRIGSAVGKYLDYAKYLRSQNATLHNSTLAAHLGQIAPPLTHIERVFVDSTYGTGEAFFLFQTASAAMMALREELDGVRGYEGMFTTLMPAEESLVAQIASAVNRAGPQLRTLLLSERHYVQLLPQTQRKTAVKKLTAIERAL